ncbi:MAG: shikimate kinase [Caldicoprobacterales bacterium]|jgi:shikimate kinase
MRNIVLIGMPASGKSTIGVLLAKALGRDFIDTDLLIQAREGALLQDIIMDKGIDEFIRIEEEVITGLDCTNTVIATGGSVVYSHEAMEHLGQKGIIVYLEVDYEEINRRLTNITSRGIVFEEGQNLIDLYNERLPLYQKYADLTIDCRDKDVETLVSLIKDKIQN